MLQLFLQCLQVIASPRGQRRQSSTMDKVWYFAAFKICTFSLSALVEAAWAASMSPCSPNSTDCLSDSLTWFSSSVNFVCTCEITSRNATSLPADSCKVPKSCSFAIRDLYWLMWAIQRLQKWPAVQVLHFNAEICLRNYGGSCSLVKKRSVMEFGDHLICQHERCICSLIYALLIPPDFGSASWIQGFLSICLDTVHEWHPLIVIIKGGEQEATKGSLHFQQA